MNNREPVGFHTSETSSLDIVENKFKIYIEKVICRNIVSAIFDLYTLELSEQNKDSPLYKYAKKLKGYNRIGCDYYFFDDDSIDLINKKKDCILYQLNNCSDSVKNKLNTRINKDFTADIITYLTNKNIQYSDLMDEEIENVEFYWG